MLRFGSIMSIQKSQAFHANSEFSPFYINLSQVPRTSSDNACLIFRQRADGTRDDDEWQLSTGQIEPSSHVASILPKVAKPDPHTLGKDDDRCRRQKRLKP